MDLPPQPDPGDFVNRDDYLRPAYHDALREWRIVCLAIIASDQPRVEPPAADAVDPHGDANTGTPATRAEFSDA